MLESSAHCPNVSRVSNTTVLLIYFCGLLFHNSTYAGARCQVKLIGGPFKEGKDCLPGLLLASNCGLTDDRVPDILRQTAIGLDSKRDIARHSPGLYSFVSTRQETIHLQCMRAVYCAQVLPGPPDLLQFSYTSVVCFSIIPPAPVPAAKSS